MTTTQYSNWQGMSGKHYKYKVYEILPEFKPVPANYIFAKVVNGQWRPVYIGQTSDLAERFDQHHKAQCIDRQGATHIHVRANRDGELARLAEEKDLIDKHRPACND